MKTKITIAIAATCLAGVAGTAAAAPPATDSSSLTQQVINANVSTTNLSVQLPTSSAYGQHQRQTGDNGIEDALAKGFSDTAAEVGNSVTSQIEDCLSPSRLADNLVDGVVNRYTGGTGFGGNMTAKNYETSVNLDNFNPKSPQWSGNLKPVTLPSPPGSTINVNTDLPTQTVQIPSTPGSQVNTDLPTQRVQIPSSPGAPGNINTDLPPQKVKLPGNVPTQPKLVGSSVYSGSGV